MRRKYKYKPKKKESGATIKRMIRDRMGDRPSFDGSDVSLSLVLNWYNSMYDDPQLAYNAVLQYLLDAGAQKSSALWIANRSFFLKRVSSSYWAIADLINTGEDLPQAVINRFRLRLKNLLAKKPEQELEYRPKSEQEKTRDLIGDIEQIVDENFQIIRNMKRPRFDFNEFIAERNVTSDQQAAIVEFYKPQYQELVDAFKGRIDEGYAHLKPVQIKAMAEVLSSIILAEVEKPASERKQRAVRKTKVKVTKNKSKKVRGVKAPPPAFHNQSATIIYYPGQKQVAVLFAEDNKKLLLTRKTIQNINPKKSYAKRFGKQQATLKNMKKSKFDKVLQFVDSVPATKLPAPGRYRDGAVIINIRE